MNKTRLATKSIELSLAVANAIIIIVSKVVWFFSVLVYPLVVVIAMYVLDTQEVVE